jgi:hypothetical protein
MNSSTSSSERGFVRSALTAFVCGALVLLVPYESLVRASERVYGFRRASTVMPRTLSPKVDGFMADFDSGFRYGTYAVGTSRMEWSFRPDVLDPFLGPTYNMGFGGTSSIVTLEFLGRLGLHPQRLIVSVSPRDFTQLSIRLGEKAIALSGRGSDLDRADERGPAAWSRVAFRAMLHGSSPQRHRNLGQWLELRRDRGSVLAFLNNEDATGDLNWIRLGGYRPATKIAAQDEIIQWADIPHEYASERSELFPRLAAAVRRFQERGATVTLVRIPTSVGMRRAEDGQTSFDADMRILSRTCGVSYIDGSTLMGTAFAFDRRNFSDAEHLNSTGALRFSRALADALTSRAPLTPRGDGVARLAANSSR